MGNDKVRWVPLVFDRDIDAYNEVMAHFTQTILAAHRQWKGNENVAVCQSVPDEGITSEIAETERDQLRETLAFAAQYKGIEARACPLCVYENGKFVEACQMHRDMEALRLQLIGLQTEYDRLNSLQSSTLLESQQKDWTIAELRQQLETLQRNNGLLLQNTPQYTQGLATRVASLEQVNTRLRQQVAQQDKDWLAMLHAIAKLDQVVNPMDEWSEADDSALLEEFDPWRSLRDLQEKVEAMRQEVAEQAGWKTVPLGEYADENGKVLELFEDETVLCIRLTIFNPRYDSYGHHEAIWQVPDNWRLQRKRRTESEGE